MEILTCPGPGLAGQGWPAGQVSVRVVPEERRDDEDAARSIHIRQVTVYVQTPSS